MGCQQAGVAVTVTSLGPWDQPLVVAPLWPAPAWKRRQLVSAGGREHHHHHPQTPGFKPSLPPSLGPRWAHHRRNRNSARHNLRRHRGFEPFRRRYHKRMGWLLRRLPKPRPPLRAGRACQSGKLLDRDNGRGVPRGVGAAKLASGQLVGDHRVISDCHFRKTATEYDRKPGMKWLSCTAKRQSDITLGCTRWSRRASRGASQSSWRRPLRARRSSRRGLLNSTLALPQALRELRINARRSACACPDLPWLAFLGRCWSSCQGTARLAHSSVAPSRFLAV